MKLPQAGRGIYMSAATQDFIVLTGIVIKSEPIGEYDRRVVLLTKERGKLSAFARGARRAGNRLMASTNPFSFGKFRVFAGRSSYSISEAEIVNYFEDLRTDFTGAYYGMYFLEICDYYARENNDESGMLKLLYQALRAVSSDRFENRLVRCVFELKAIMLNGEFPGISGGVLSGSTEYTITYIMNIPSEKLFSFDVKPYVLEELELFCRKICKRTFDKDFKSIEILENLE